MKLAIVLLAAVPSFAHASSTLSATSDSAFKTCLVEQMESGLHAKSVSVIKSETLVNFPAYAEATVVAHFNGQYPKEVYTVLLRTNDLKGFSNVLVDGEQTVSAVTIDSAVVRNNIGKDVIQLDVANCAE